MSVEVIEYNGMKIALIVRGEVKREGVHFFTPSESPLQLGVISHKGGTKIKPHIHREIERTINRTQEVLHVEDGCIAVDLYTPEGKKIRTEILRRGDTILLMGGGHGITVLEDSKIIEVKQGPYKGVENDKVIIKGL